MKRFAQTVMLRDDPEVVRQYEQYHAHPWPETNAGLLSVGILRMFIYRFGRQLFMFMETTDEFDLDRDMPRYMENPKAREWDQMMNQFQETVPGAPAGSKWVLMKEVYALDALKK
jgi:L-rhamnose mutarotase